MLTFQEKGAGNVLGVKAIGKLTHADYLQLVPKLVLKQAKILRPARSRGPRQHSSV